MEKLISIVVPAYNIKDYIYNCLEHFNQVSEEYLELFEVLVVNDGSHDETPQIVEDYMTQAKYDLRLINKENGGHGSTINQGMHEAVGYYFKVVDGDDWVIPQEFQKLLDALKDKQADMVITDYTEQHVYNNTSILKSYSDKFEEGKLYTGIPKEWIRMHTLTYKRSILVDHNIRLSEKTFYVDVQYTLFPLEYVASYKYIKADVYQYFIGREDQSMNLNVMKQKRDHHDRVVRSVIDFYALTQKPDIIEVLDTLLTRLINDQVLINLMSDDGDQLNRELFAYMEQKGFKFKLNLGNKTSGLAYINYQTKGVLSWLIKPLINKKIASYQDAKSLR